MSVFIIAEAGVNHNGDLGIAKQLVDVAAEAGADAVKFQSFVADHLVCADAELANYQKEQSNASSQLEMLKALQLSVADHEALIAHCAERNIEFMSTPFDLESLELLESLGVRRYKIPSGEITNYPLLRSIGQKGKPVICSTGMSDFEEVKSAVDVLKAKGVVPEAITILHANSEYPTPMVDVHLNAMVKMGHILGLNYGYSDHTLGIEVPVAAVALGATVIEKHFTLDRNMDGPDHQASLMSEELSSMVKSIRNIELALGQSKKQPSPSEIKNRDVVRKSIVAKTPIKKGDLFSEGNLTTKRPGHGRSPMEWTSLIGQPAKRDYQRDELI